MKLEVYQTDAEAFEAAAALVGERLRGARPRWRSRRPRWRGVMVALAARGACRGTASSVLGRRAVRSPRDPLSNVRLARDSLLGPRAVPAERIHPRRSSSATPTHRRPPTRDARRSARARRRCSSHPARASGKTSRRVADAGLRRRFVPPPPVARCDSTKSRWSHTSRASRSRAGHRGRRVTSSSRHGDEKARAVAAARASRSTPTASRRSSCGRATGRVGGRSRRRGGAAPWRAGTRRVGGCPSKHVGCSERSGGCERGARQSDIPAHARARAACLQAPSSVVLRFPLSLPGSFASLVMPYSDRLLADAAGRPRGCALNYEVHGTGARLVVLTHVSAATRLLVVPRGGERDALTACSAGTCVARAASSKPAGPYQAVLFAPNLPRSSDHVARRTRISSGHSGAAS